MTLLLRGKTDPRNAFTEIDTFKKVSGLDLNRMKSIGMGIGKAMYRNERGEGKRKHKYFNEEIEASLTS